MANGKRYYEKDLKRIPTCIVGPEIVGVMTLRVIWEPHYDDKGGKWVVLETEAPDFGKELGAHRDKPMAVNIAKRILIDRGVLSKIDKAAEAAKEFNLPSRDYEHRERE